MSRVEARTPMTLIVGSLGSGKTTLLRRALAETGVRIAVLMNEFGEIAVDSKVIGGELVQIVELAGGCVCCSLTGEFEAAVGEILDTIRPEHIVVEATGVAEADALVREVEERIPRVRLDSVVCVVDAYSSVVFPSVGYASRSQIEAADVVLLNKIDLVAPGQVEEAVARVRQFNGKAALLKTVRCAGDPYALFGMEPRERAAPPRAAADGPAFESFAWESDRALDEAKFRELAADLPPSVFRAKGFVRFPGGGFLFNYVAGRADFEEFPAKSTRLVFIGPSAAADRDAVLARLSRCGGSK